MRVFVGAAFPGMVRSGEVDDHSRFLHLSVAVTLAAVVRGDGASITRSSTRLDARRSGRRGRSHLFITTLRWEKRILTPRMRRPFLLLIGLAVAAPSLASWEQAFRQGVRAFERKQWSVAAAYLQQALAERPDSDRELVNINGGFNVQYLPRHYLAAALAHGGDCNGARSTLLSVRDNITGGEKERLVRVVEMMCPAPAPAEEALRQPAPVQRLESEPPRAQPAAEAAVEKPVVPYQLLTLSANVAFNAPKQMNVGEHRVIQLLLDTRRSSSEIARDIVERGTKVTAQLGVSPQVKVYLTGSAFAVRPITAQEQAISDKEPTEWKWELTAREVGRQRLFLTVDAIFVGGGGEVRRSVRTFDISSTIVAPSPRPHRRTEPAPRRRSR